MFVAGFVVKVMLIVSADCGLHLHFQGNLNKAIVYVRLRGQSNMQMGENQSATILQNGATRTSK